MSVQRDVPYGMFNFTVELGDGLEAAFQEVGPLTQDLHVVEYRSGADKDTSPRKLPGLTRVADVSLKRGVTGALGLFEWLHHVRTNGPGGARTVRIHLLSEDHGQVVFTWTLLRAWPRRLSYGPLHARGTEVAMEELVLTYERLEIE